MMEHRHHRARLLMTDGFESTSQVGRVRRYGILSGESALLTTVAGRRGGLALRCGGASAIVMVYTLRSPFPADAHALGLAIRFSAAHETQTWALGELAAGAVAQIVATAEGAGVGLGVRIRLTAGGTIIGTTSAIPVGTWVYLEVGGLARDAPAGYAALRLDQSPLVVLEDGDSRAASSDTIDTVRIRLQPGLDIDDVYVSAAERPWRDMPWLGDVHAQGVRPVAMGTLTQLLPSPLAGNWENVDDPVPDDDASYVVGSPATLTDQTDRYRWGTPDAARINGRILGFGGVLDWRQESSVPPTRRVALEFFDRRRLIQVRDPETSGIAPVAATWTESSFGLYGAPRTRGGPVEAQDLAQFEAGPVVIDEG